MRPHNESVSVVARLLLVSWWGWCLCTFLVEPTWAKQGIFSLVRITSSLPSGDQDACRAKCTSKNGYVAWVLDSDEHAALMGLVPAGTIYVVLGGNRRMGNGTIWRWTEGPMGAMDGGLGMPFYRGTTSSGTALAYTAFGLGQPDNAGAQTQLCVSVLLGLYWDDCAALVISGRVSYCACRSGTPTMSDSSTVQESLSPTVTWTPTRTPTIARNSSTLILTVTHSVSSSLQSPTHSTSARSSYSEEATCTPSVSRGASSASTTVSASTATHSFGTSTIAAHSVSSSIQSSTRSASVRSSDSVETPVSSTSTVTTSRSSLNASVTKTASKCHHITGANTTTVVERVQYDASIIHPIASNSIWTNSAAEAPPPNASSEVRSATILFFEMTKTDAIRQAAEGGAGAVVLRLVLWPSMYVDAALVNSTIASAPNAAVVVLPWAAVDGSSTIEVRVRPIGNQFLSQEAKLLVPLRAIDGACVDPAAPQVEVSLRMTPTVPLTVAIAKGITSSSAAVAASVSPTTAVAMTRLSILMELIDCNVDLHDDTGNSLLGLALGPSDGQYMRGAVVGNVLIVAAVAAAVVGIAGAVATYWRLRFGLSASLSLGLLCNTLHFPGILYVPVLAVAQPTMTAAVQMMVLEPIAGDRLLGAMAAVAVLTMALLLTVAVCQHFCLVLAPRTDDDTAKVQRKIEAALTLLSCGCWSSHGDPPEGNEHEQAEHLERLDGIATNASTENVEDVLVELDGACRGHSTSTTDACGSDGNLRCENPTKYSNNNNRAAAALMRVMVGTHHWVPVAVSPHSLMWKQKFIVMFADTRRWWFPVLELWLSVVVGIGGGLTLGSKSVCRGQLGLMAAAYLFAVLLQMVAVVALVPISRVFATVLQGLGLLSCASIVVVLVQDDDGETIALTVATSCMLAVAVIATLKTVLDVGVLLIAIPTLVNAMRHVLAGLLSAEATVQLLSAGSDSPVDDADDFNHCSAQEPSAGVATIQNLPDSSEDPGTTRSDHLEETNRDTEMAEIAIDCADTGNSDDTNFLLNGFHWAAQDGVPCDAARRRNDKNGIRITNQSELFRFYGGEEDTDCDILGGVPVLPIDVHLTLGSEVALERVLPIEEELN